jgi:hypothetical protein
MSSGAPGGRSGYLYPLSYPDKFRIFDIGEESLANMVDSLGEHLSQTQLLAR